MSRPIVYVARRIPQIGLDILSQHAQIRLHTGSLPPTRAELLLGVQGAAGILSLLSDRIDGEVMDSAGPQLKVVSNFAVGFNNIDVEAAKQRKIAVGNTPGVLTDATADIAVALLLAAARRLKEGWQAVDQHQWHTWEPLGWIGQDLKGKTLGIIGMGRIGQAVAERMYGGWKMRVLYTSRHPKPLVNQMLGAQHVDLDELLKSSDFISIHVALNDATRGSINATTFSKMKSTAVLVNTSRGEVIDQAALIEALSSDRIFAAGLDVCDPEPLPATSPLRQLKNCLLVPHIGSATVSARNAMSERAANNVVAGIKELPLPYPVT